MYFKNFLILLAFFTTFVSTRGTAQVLPDNSLGTESSTVLPNQTINGVESNLIEGGAQRGRNLFHSFKEFNVEVGRGAYFANPAGIENILGRVTGNNASQILGRLGVIGNANLFLLNPNGVVFGSNASLDLNGSFFGTTAEKILFPNNIDFSAVNHASPMLSSQVPIGLGLGSNPGSILVKGNGHNLGFNTFEPTVRLPAFSSLSVSPGQTLALIGGKIAFDGGVVSAEDGRVELGAAAGGNVYFSLNKPDNFRYDTLQLRNISFQNRALADVSGRNGGSIQVTASKASFQTGSGLFVQNYVGEPAGNIDVSTRSVEIIGGLPEPVLFFNQRADVIVLDDPQTVRAGFVNGTLISFGTPLSQVLETFGLSLENAESLTTFLPSFIFSESIQDGQGAKIKVSADRLSITNGAQLLTRSFDSANAGNLLLDIKNRVDVRGISNTPGFAEQGFEVFSQINSTTFGSGSGGLIQLNTDTLSASESGNITSVSLGKGNSGNVNINADRIQLTELFPPTSTGSTINTIALSEGNAGNITINTASLSLTEGANISSSTYSGGNAGEININATDVIKVIGRDLETKIPSAIASGGLILSPALQNYLSLSPSTTGEAGSITLLAGHIEISDGAIITALNQGEGNAGNIQLIVDSIALSDQGNISASTVSGQGGNITLNTDSLRLRNDSGISATAGGAGDGGNISINADTIVGSGNSDITANASQGRGGQIEINTEGIFGLFIRGELTPFNDITAFSEAGPELNGEIRLNIDSELQNDLETQEVDVASVEQLIASSCMERNPNQSSFTRRGTGALPPTPDTGLPVWEIPDSSATPQNNWQLGDPIIEATNLQPDSEGDLQIVATNSKAASQNNVCY